MQVWFAFSGRRSSAALCVCLSPRLWGPGRFHAPERCRSRPAYLRSPTAPLWSPVTAGPPGPSANGWPVLAVWALLFGPLCFLASLFFFIVISFLRRSSLFCPCVFFLRATCLSFSVGSGLRLPLTLLPVSPSVGPSSFPPFWVYLFFCGSSFIVHTRATCDALFAPRMHLSACSSVLKRKGVFLCCCLESPISSAVFCHPASFECVLLQHFTALLPSGFLRPCIVHYSLCCAGSWTSSVLSLQVFRSLLVRPRLRLILAEELSSYFPPTDNFLYCVITRLNTLIRRLFVCFA